MKINLKKIKNFIDKGNHKILSFEKIQAESLLISDILNEKNFQKNINKSLKRNMPACIIYTSGTSGNPKRVVLSHGGILANWQGGSEILNPLIKNKDPIFLTWLPLSHSYEHAVQFIQILLGGQSFLCREFRKTFIKYVCMKPTIMTAVPRFYQNLF